MDPDSPRVDAPPPRVGTSPLYTPDFTEQRDINNIDASSPRVGMSPTYVGPHTSNTHFPNSTPHLSQGIPIVGYEPSELRKEPLPIPVHRTFPHRGHATNFRNIAARTILAQHLFEPKLNHLFQPNGMKETLDSVLRGKDAATWQRSLSNEIGRLAQGNDRCHIHGYYRIYT